MLWVGVDLISEEQESARMLQGGTRRSGRGACSGFCADVSHCGFPLSLISSAHLLGHSQGETFRKTSRPIDLIPDKPPQRRCSRYKISRNESLRTMEFSSRKRKRRNLGRAK